MTSFLFMFPTAFPNVQTSCSNSSWSVPSSELDIKGFLRHCTRPMRTSLFAFAVPEEKQVESEPNKPKIAIMDL